MVGLRQDRLVQAGRGDRIRLQGHSARRLHPDDRHGAARPGRPAADHHHRHPAPAAWSATSSRRPGPATGRRSPRPMTAGSSTSCTRQADHRHGRRTGDEPDPGRRHLRGDHAGRRRPDAEHHGRAGQPMRDPGRRRRYRPADRMHRRRPARPRPRSPACCPATDRRLQRHPGHQLGPADRPDPGRRRAPPCSSTTSATASRSPSPSRSCRTSARCSTIRASRSASRTPGSSGISVTSPYTQQSFGAAFTQTGEFIGAAAQGRGGHPRPDPGALGRGVQRRTPRSLDSPVGIVGAGRIGGEILDSDNTSSTDKLVLFLQSAGRLQHEPVPAEHAAAAAAGRRAHPRAR